VLIQSNFLQKHDEGKLPTLIQKKLLDNSF
jgi:hypothetical protein